MGVGVPGGCEKILHWANSLLLDPDNPRFAFQSDWAAAFQNVERGKMFETLGARKELDRLYRFTRWSYSLGSPIFCRGSDGQFIDPDLASLKGVRQGDPLGPLLFAVAAHFILEEAERFGLEAIKGLPRRRGLHHPRSFHRRDQPPQAPRVLHPDPDSREEIRPQTTALQM